MKYTFPLLMILTIHCTAEKKEHTGSSNMEYRNKHLDSFFNNPNYKVLNEKLPIAIGDVAVALQYIDSDEEIFTKGIGFITNKGKFIPVIYFYENKIVGMDSNTIFDASQFQYKPFGWKISFSITKNPEKFGNGFNLIYISDNGKRITDGPTILWEKNEHKFKELVFDPSMFE